MKYFYGLPGFYEYNSKTLLSWQPDMINLKHLRTLTALKETGSVSEAAERLCLTQSALSHQLKELEERLEFNLFIRKSKPLRFTLAGQRLLDLADDVLPLMRNAERDLIRLAGGESGRLHAAIECHSCFQWLMPALDLFRDNWPDVELDLSASFNFAPLPALTRGDLDLVITSDPEEISGVSFIPLFKYELLVAVSKHHPFASAHHLTPDTFQGETLITYPVDRQRLDVFTQFLDPANVEPAEIRTSELTQMMLQWVASSRGVCALPNWALTEYLEKDFVVGKRLGKQGVWGTLYAALRTEQLELPFIQDFLRTAKETCFKTLSGIHAAG